MEYDRSRPSDEALDARRAWLFPAARGSWRGFDLALLDPSDRHDRAVVVSADHPEIGEGDEDEDGDEQGWSPRLHLAIHEVVSNQLWDGDPPEMGEAADRLRSLGRERHDILHMLGTVVAEDIYRAMKGEDVLDDDERRRRLDALPGSWEEIHADDEEDMDWDEEDDDEEDMDWDEEDDDEDWDEDEELLADVHDLLAERGPLSLDELAAELDADRDAIDALVADPALVLVAEGKVASAYAALEGVTLTHRLSRAEGEMGTVELGTGLSPLEAWSCEGDHLHLPGERVVELREAPDGVVRLAPDDLGLPALGEGSVIGFALAGLREDVATVTPLVLATVPAITDSLRAQLRRSAERLSHEDRMPVEPLQLLCQLLLDAPACAAQPLPPLEALLEDAGFEIRDGYAAPAGADWEGFEQVRSLARVAARRNLTRVEARGLTMLVQAAHLSTEGGTSGRPPKDMAAGLAHMLCDSELAEAFAEAMRDDPGTARSFVRELRQVGGRHHEAGLWWCESLVTSRSGDAEAAESCLRSAIVADPECTPALLDAAWCASDRGDATAAVRLLERADDDDEARLALLRRFSAQSAPAPRVGRNDPCPCGSGRKYKQCCLARPGGATNLPLGVRVRWLWEKMHWWVERQGPADDVLAITILLQGTWRGSQGTPVQFAADRDVATSLVLFAEGAVADFIAERGSLLPVDEANLAAQWALSGPSVHEVQQVRAGEGFGLRDLRTGDVVAVQERSGSRALRDGDLVFAHPVFDGSAHQIVGGIVPVTLGQRGPLMDLLDGEEGASAIADELARTRRAPQLVNTEGEPTLLCQGTYRLDDPDATAARLDAVLDRRDGDHWVETVERDGQSWVRANASIDGTTLTLFANSEARFQRVKDAATAALGSLDVLEETREPVGDVARRLEVERGAGAGTGTATSARGERFELPPGAIEAMEQFVREREVAWLDEPVPALSGLTPRQAADDPTRREDLLALLHEYERTSVPEGAVGYDVARLRQLLGLR